MTMTLIKWRLFPNKNKVKIKPELKNTKSNLPPNLQTFKQKLLSRNGFFIYRESFSIHWMSIENFELIVNESIDNSIIEKDFLQQAANLNDSDQTIEYKFGEIINYQ